MVTAICIMAPAYLIMGKDVKGLMKAMRGVDRRGRMEYEKME